jgi:hypothetical protein
MSGQWPPEWEDPDDERPDAGPPDQGPSDNGHSERELSEVTAFLASVRSPALPASFEARISAAIAAESAARATTEPGIAAESAGPVTAVAGADGAKDTDRSDNPEGFSPAATSGGRSTRARRGPRRGAGASRSAAAASGPGGSRPGSGRRRLRMPSMQATSWTLVCVLVLAGFGFLVTRGSQSSSSSAPYSAAPNQPSAAAGSAESRPAAGLSPEHADVGPEADGADRFVVHSTGTSYQRATLASQARDQLANLGRLNPTTSASSASASAPGQSPAASASASGPAADGGSPPSAQLSGCVSAVTGGVAPSLVDKASYDGIPAYIIAVPTEVWVVRRGCTAADTQLIARAPLTG